jgi:hypothetical protein
MGKKMRTGLLEFACKVGKGHIHPFFSRRYAVQILLQTVKQEKNLILGGAQAFQTILLKVVVLPPKN